jgi:hypothetical protein
MAKAKRAKFTQYHGPSVTRHKHICYVTKPDSQPKMSTSFLTVPSNTSNGKAGDSINDDTLLRIDNILLNAEALDPAYIEHLAETSIEQSRRPQGALVNVMHPDHAYVQPENEGPTTPSLVPRT